MLSLREALIGGTTPSAVVADTGLAALRVGAGLMMAFGHGLGKIPPPAGFVDLVGGVGLPVPVLFAWLAALAESAGGLLLAAGLATRPAAAAILVTMLIAAFGAHLAVGDPLFASGGPSAEKAVLYALVALAFVTAGSGRLSGDYLLRKARA